MKAPRAELTQTLDTVEQEFVGLHVDLKRDASTRAAQAILDLVRRTRSSEASAQ